jgi:uncharacterized protein (DUF58 family)
MARSANDPYPSHDVHVESQGRFMPVTEADYARRHSARCAALIAAVARLNVHAPDVRVTQLAEQFEHWILRP